MGGGTVSDSGEEFDGREGGSGGGETRIGGFRAARGAKGGGESLAAEHRSKDSLMPARTVMVLTTERT